MKTQNDTAGILLSPPPCSALDCALALLACGTQHGGNNAEWLEAAWKMADHCKGREDVTEAALRVVAESREWYRHRMDMLARLQKRMRDPERQLVCDILANGQLLPDPKGKRYGFPTTGNDHFCKPNTSDHPPR